MKSINFLIIMATFLLLSSCMSSTCFIGPTIPPEKQLPDEIKSLVIVNRTYEPSNLFTFIKTKSFGKQDRAGIPECVNAMGYEFASNKNYKIFTDTKGLTAPQSAYFPEPISASEIKFICSDFGVDAIIAIEVFDVFTNIKYIEGVKIQTDSSGKKHEIKTVTVVENNTVTVGWRVYNSKNDTIADQYKMQNHFEREFEGVNKADAVSKLPALENILRNIGTEIGRNYVKRFLSKDVTVCRSYFGKENDGLKKAKLFVKANNWDAAKDIWFAQTNSTDNKTAGRAFNNLAIYYERQKDINKTYEMLLKADQFYKNYYTTDYITNLHYMYLLK